MQRDEEARLRVTAVPPLMLAIVLCVLMVTPVPAQSPPPLPPARRIIFHSDGKAWDSENIILPYLPGTQTDSCTYSLIHGFNRGRYYRTQVIQPWPPGYVESLGSGDPDELDKYITFCGTNGYEAIWAHRMNDTHDSVDDEDGRWNFAHNDFKQQNPELLIGEMRWPTPSSPDGKWYMEDFTQCPHGRWSSVDYTHQAVRDQAFLAWEEVCNSYDIDGLMLDFFRHPTSFRSTAMGGHASAAEVAAMTSLLLQARQLVDQVGAQRGRPILLAVRTPDEPRYAEGLGLDIEDWMAQGIIDIWIAAGYFRLQEWEDIVALGHSHGVAVWGSLDEIRTGRPACNSMEAYRARAMNMWHAGVDGIYVFNFGYKPPSQMFDLLHELGDPADIAHLPKMYVPDPRHDPSGIQWWLNGGEQYVTKTNGLQALPRDLTDGQANVVHLLVGDDVPAAVAQGPTPAATLRLYVSGLTDVADLIVTLDGAAVTGGSLDPASGLVEFSLGPGRVSKGFNRFEVALTAASQTTTVLEDLQLWISYGHRISPGDWFVADYTSWSGHVFHCDSSGTVLESAGGFHEPRGMDIGPDGNLYIVHNINRVVQSQASDFLDTADVITTGIDGAHDMAFGSDDNLFLACRSPWGVVKRWNGPGNPPAWGAETEFAAASLGRPLGIAFGPNGDLYVADSDSAGEIERYAGATGVRIGAAPFVSDGTHFSAGQDICFGPDGNLYVSDTGGNGIVAYQGPNGVNPADHVGTFVSPGTGGLIQPAGIAFGNDGDLYVCDPGTAKVLRFQGPYGASPGAFVSEFIDLGPGRIPWFLVQAPLPPPERGALLLVE